MPKNNLLKGSSQDIIDTNVKTLVSNGYTYKRALGTALKTAKKRVNTKRITDGVTRQDNQVSIKGS